MTDSPAALRRSLESHFKNASRRTGQPSSQIRRAFFHQCYLARIFTLPNNDWVLKGGVGLAVRVTNARHSKDIDLYRRDAHDELDASIEQLITAGEGPSGRDPFTFEVTRKDQIIGAAGGITLSVKCLLGTLELDRFPIDLTTRQHTVGQLEEITPEDLIHIPQVQPSPPMLVYPLADQVADKLAAMYEIHAHGHPSSRYRDLVDLVLITLDGLHLDPDELHRAIKAQQSLRGVTIPIPLTPPGEHWHQQYRKLSQDTPGVPTRLRNLTAALAHVEEHLRDTLLLVHDSPAEEPRP